MNGIKQKQKSFVMHLSQNAHSLNKQQLMENVVRYVEMKYNINDTLSG